METLIPPPKSPPCSLESILESSLYEIRALTLHPSPNNTLMGCLWQKLGLTNKLVQIEPLPFAWPPLTKYTDATKFA